MKALIQFLMLFIMTNAAAQPADDIVVRNILKERKIVKYPPLREGDIFWQKRISRVIDVREKMNQPFVYPKAPLFDVLTEAVVNGDINAYSAEGDRFSYQLSIEELKSILVDTDTVEIIDPQDFVSRLEVTQTHIYYEDIKRFRLSEIWFFDENTGSLHVRILGIAPLMEVYDDYGNFKYERPLFWLHYPALRPVLARAQVYVEGNEAQPVSWEDVFERRQFSSTITSTTNVLDMRIQDTYTGLDALWEADKIKAELFNFEHDLWEY